MKTTIFKTLVVFFFLIISMTGIGLTAPLFTVTSDGAVYTGIADVQAAAIWLGTSTDTVTFYEGTDNTGTFLFKLDSDVRYITLPNTFNITNIYADCSWSGTGSGNPRATIYVR